MTAATSPSATGATPLPAPPTTGGEVVGVGEEVPFEAPALPEYEEVDAPEVGS